MRCILYHTIRHINSFSLWLLIMITYLKSFVNVSKTGENFWQIWNTLWPKYTHKLHQSELQIMWNGLPGALSGFLKSSRELSCGAQEGRLRPAGGKGRWSAPIWQMDSLDPGRVGRGLRGPRTIHLNVLPGGYIKVKDALFKSLKIHALHETSFYWFLLIILNLNDKLPWHLWYEMIVKNAGPFLAIFCFWNFDSILDQRSKCKSPYIITAHSYWFIAKHSKPYVTLKNKLSHAHILPSICDQITSNSISNINLGKINNCQLWGLIFDPEFNLKINCQSMQQIWD